MWVSQGGYNWCHDASFKANRPLGASGNIIMIIRSPARITITGKVHYTSADATKAIACKGGKAKITAIYQLGKSKHPYHLVAVSGSGATVYGWVDAGTFTKA